MKVYENTGLGLLLGDRLSFNVGPYPIDFDPSLLDMPGATFGNRLVNALPRADYDHIESDGLPRYILTGMSAEDVKADDRALVRVTITSGVKDSFGYSTEQPDLVQVLKCATEQHSEMKGLDLPTIRSWSVTTALIVLEPGAEITFKTSWETRQWRSFWQWLRRRKAALEHRERTTTYAYDGRSVSVNEHITCLPN